MLATFLFTCPPNEDISEVYCFDYIQIVTFNRWVHDDLKIKQCQNITFVLDLAYLNFSNFILAASVFSVYFFTALSTISLRNFSPERNNFRKTQHEGQNLSKVFCSAVVHINLNLSPCPSLTYLYKEWLEFLIVKTENYYVLLCNSACHTSLLSCFLSVRSF